MDVETWRDEASRQAGLLSARLGEALAQGLQWLDAGLEPGSLPPWAAPLAACVLLLAVVLLAASVWRRAGPAAGHVAPAPATGVPGGPGKSPRAEEPRRRRKRAQQNGRAGPEPREDAGPEELPHQQQDPPAEPARLPETKKSKKKAKQAVKETKTVSADRKEPEEGTWETKVSNKEKREQRKKDKGSSDGSASPGGGNASASAPPEQPKASGASPPPASQKKKKDSAKVKTEKVEAGVSQVNSRETVEVAAAATDMAIKGRGYTVAPNSGSWTPPTQAAPLWRAGIDESWTVIDRQLPSKELKLVSLSGLGVGPAKPQPVSDLSWLSQPRVDDEWSGLNGGSADPSSDWNAPSEAWGNYEETTPKTAPAKEQPRPEPAKANQMVAEVDDDVKDKGDATTDGAAKNKKKKKKKKKAAEDGGAADQVEEPVKETPPVVSGKKQPPVQESPAAVPARAAAGETRGERTAKDVITQKPPVTQVPQKPTEGDPTAKQNNLPAPPQQKKAEESQAPKPAKKKKARRET
ncbi:protein LYRIC-like isoform X1 [Cololabis saira]|uniref:protein LYRIC-like isoform X1 n=1 Tax=Cololabis saira TaxID=129043 RepID=UPI002AD39882|nr:protein LYRIC-like isoform X1 [Cololabis saira]